MSKENTNFSPNSQNIHSENISYILSRERQRRISSLRKRLSFSSNSPNVCSEKSSSVGNEKKEDFLLLGETKEDFSSPLTETKEEDVFVPADSEFWLPSFDPELQPEMKEYTNIVPMTPSPRKKRSSPEHIQWPGKRMSLSQNEIEKNKSIPPPPIIITRTNLLLPLIICHVGTNLAELILFYTGLDYSGVRWSQKNLTNLTLEYFNFIDACLDFNNFSDTLFVNCILFQTSLNGSTFHGAGFENMTLYWNNLNNTDLSECDIQNCSIESISQQDVNIILQCCTIDKCSFTNASFRNVDLSYASLNTLKCSDCTFKWTNFSHSKIINLTLQRGQHNTYYDQYLFEFQNCNFTSAAIEYTSLTEVKLKNCNFTNTKFISVTFGISTKKNSLCNHLTVKNYMCYKNCDFTGAIFENCSFEWADFRECKFANAVFCGTTSTAMTDITFSNCVMNNIKILPPDIVIKSNPPKLKDVWFKGSNLSNSVLENLHLEDVYFVNDTNLSYVSFKHSGLCSVKFGNTVMLHVNFSYTHVADCTFSLFGMNSAKLDYAIFINNAGNPIAGNTVSKEHFQGDLIFN